MENATLMCNESALPFIIIIKLSMDLLHLFMHVNCKLLYA